MKKLLLPLIATLSFTTSAQTFHVSPDLKIGIYNGAGIQLGVADTLGMDAVFFSYGRKTYNTNRYDERLDSYRLGLQHMFGHKQDHGLQAEFGLADYYGRDSRDSESSSRSSLGLSIGASYVYMLNSSFGLKTGFDYDVFNSQDTYIPVGSNMTLNFGVIGRF
ncbi:hypothetical protein [Vibrio sp. McD22-P3]|uniref:hypothetical protein n=1 Tax=Vibrio sp. McD22-P3 TaxID=2724880 RepID=UPI001F2F63F3|nr:hypothetical protein [Vibrio sp. McD22-P3]MCF4176376.1 hypothetical protein [Vibrio sp. McD22-P3]